MVNYNAISKEIGISSSNKIDFTKDLSKWKVLIVDDDDDVHKITKLAMLGVNYDGLPIEFYSAYSGKEACEFMENHYDVALVILDVVMESDDSGILVADYIRKNLGNSLVRIVLRTGQPGQTPEDEIIEKYDINDYKEKTELTAQKLRMMIRANLHAFKDKRHVYYATNNIIQLSSLSHQLVGFTNLKSATMYIYENLFLNIHKRKPRTEEYIGHIFSFINIANSKICDYRDYHTGKKIEESELPSPLIVDTAVNRTGIFTDNKMTTLCFSDYHGIVFYFEFPSSIPFIYNSNLSDLLQETLSNHYRNLYLNDLLNQHQREIMYRICEVVETRSKESGVHVKRVSEYCTLLAKLAGVPEKEINLLRHAAPLHDLGKIAIPDNILHKPGKLDDYEWEVMKTHAQIGYEMLKDSNIELFNVAAEVAFYHHEKWNGKGYPNGLSGELIPINGRITAIADVFDALASERCYKPKWPMDKIFKLFQQERGEHFDPRLTDIFLENFDKFVEIRNRIDDL